MNPTLLSFFFYLLYFLYPSGLLPATAAVDTTCLSAQAADPGGATLTPTTLPASTFLQTMQQREAPTVKKHSQQKITTFLWFDDDAEEAVRLYTSIFADSKVLAETRWDEGGTLPKGTLMTSRFQLAGQEFMALNGGPMYRFTEAISLLVSCTSQAEVDELWDKLSAGGEPGRCGWLKDKYGLSWQIIPAVLVEMLQDKDPAKVKRVTAAMMKMTKLDIGRLQQAYDGR